MDKTLLVLGIGPTQADLIEAGNEIGLRVVACAYDSEGPGKELVDDFKQIDIKDLEAVKQYAVEEEVDFIYSMGLELSVEAIAHISEDLGLPSFVSTETYEKIQNKAVWREKLGNTKGNVAFFKGKTVEDFEQWDTYPAILKPVDGSGQRGVHEVANYQEVKDIFDESIQFSNSGQLIIEDYVDGPEISVNTFVQDGELEFAIISDRISYDEYPGGIIKAHYIPSRIVTEEAEETIYELVREVIKQMEFVNGHVYFQLKVEDGQPQLIEFTPRFDACHMWNLIHHATGLDLRKVSLEILAYGESEHLNNYKETEVKAVETHFISDVPEMVVNKENYEVPNDALYTQWYYDEGEKVKTVTGYLEKVGYYIVEK